MEQATQIVSQISGYIWGIPLMVLLVGTGVYLTVGLHFYSWLKIPSAIRLMWDGRRKGAASDGEITPFQALMTAMSATVGTGNIAGVATAVALGGPGAIFWMWCTALFGMATKYAEAVLAVKYREVDEAGEHVGGPMYYILNGLGPKWRFMAGAFAVACLCAGFGAGNTVQANSMADALQASFGVPKLATGLVVAALVALVTLGGIRRIGTVASFIVPFMAIVYVAAAVYILAANIPAIPAAFALIFDSAFSGTAATGGFAGAMVAEAMRWGVARGLFSNEAGLGSAAIAHAAAQTKDPVRQGTIAMLGTLFDTLVICTMTALVLIVTGVWNSGENGAPLTAMAFEAGIIGRGDFIVSLGIIFFAFSTILGWSFYAEKCVEFLFGIKAIRIFRIFWVLAIPLGATSSLTLIWGLADIANGFMALPNLIAMLVLSPVVFRITRGHKPFSFVKPEEH